MKIFLLLVLSFLCAGCVAIISRRDKIEAVVPPVGYIQDALYRVGPVPVPEGVWL